MVKEDLVQISMTDNAEKLRQNFDGLLKNITETNHLFGLINGSCASNISTLKEKMKAYLADKLDPPTEKKFIIRAFKVLIGKYETFVDDMHRYVKIIADAADKIKSDKMGVAVTGMVNKCKRIDYKIENNLEKLNTAKDQKNVDNRKVRKYQKKLEKYTTKSQTQAGRLQNLSASISKTNSCVMAVRKYLKSSIRPNLSSINTNGTEYLLGYLENHTSKPNEISNKIDSLLLSSAQLAKASKRRGASMEDIKTDIENLEKLWEELSSLEKQLKNKDLVIKPGQLQKLEAR